MASRRSSTDALITMLAPSERSEKDPNGRNGDRDHDGRVAEREEEPDSHWPLSERNEPTQHVVDRADVVRIKTVTQAQRPRDQTQGES